MRGLFWVETNEVKLCPVKGGFCKYAGFVRFRPVFFRGDWRDDESPPCRMPDLILPQPCGKVLGGALNAFLVVAGKDDIAIHAVVVAGITADFHLRVPRLRFAQNCGKRAFRRLHPNGRGAARRPLPRDFGEFAPAPTPDAAARPARKPPPGRAANVREDNPPTESAGCILPPKKPPHLTDCRRPFPPPRAAADGRRMLRAGPARLRRRDPCPLRRRWRWPGAGRGGAFRAAFARTRRMRRAGGKSLSPRPRAELNPEGRGRDIPLSGRITGGGMWRARRGIPRGRREAGRRKHPSRGGRFRARVSGQTIPRIGRVVFSPHKHMAI